MSQKDSSVKTVNNCGITYAPVVIDIEVIEEYFDPKIRKAIREARKHYEKNAQ